MAAVYDFRCAMCGTVKLDIYAASPECGPVCGCNGEQMEWLPSLRGRLTPFSRDETTVIWENKRTGAVRYPGRNDVQIPPKYAAQGYERRELRHDHEVARFEREHNVVNERRHFNRNGRGLELPLPEI